MMKVITSVLVLILVAVGSVVSSATFQAVSKIERRYGYRGNFVDIDGPSLLFLKQQRGQNRQQLLQYRQQQQQQQKNNNVVGFLTNGKLEAKKGRTSPDAEDGKDIVPATQDSFANEFSRTVSPERIVSSSGNSYNKDYTLDIEAREKERQALAKRFDLSDIAQLRASLSLRREGGGSTSRGSGSSGGTSRSYISQTGIQVDGIGFATVTQTCVRTNEKFQVELEFPLNCIVRPVPPLWGTGSGGGGGGGLVEETTTTMSTTNPNSPNNNKKNKRKKNNRRSDNNNSFQQMDMMQLQRMLENIDADEDGHITIMEDQSIYTIDGMLDVGELISQLFCLQLDPYPKKPGTDPITASISG